MQITGYENDLQATADVESFAKLRELVNDFENDVKPVLLELSAIDADISELKLQITANNFVLMPQNKGYFLEVPVWLSLELNR